MSNAGILKKSAQSDKNGYREGLMDLLYTDIAIDLGTVNTLIHMRQSGIVLNQPSIVALNNEGSPIAIGSKAMLIHEKTHSGVSTVRPLKDGVIADFKVAEQMLTGMIKSVKKNWYSNLRRMVICVPYGITQVEKRAVRDSAEQAGGREVYLVDEPMAAAIGAGMNVHEPVGNMIVDIGGGTSEIAVIALSGIVEAESVRIGGDLFNEQIGHYLRRHHKLLVGERTAERVKCEIGCTKGFEEKNEITVAGRDLVTGFPRTRTITSDEVRDAIAESVDGLILAVIKTLERTPPELSADIMDKGITLAGGGGMLKGLDLLIEDATGLTVHTADDPITAVIRGTGAILDDLYTYRNVLSWS